MRTHSMPSFQNRSSADGHKGNGVSFPAAQLYGSDTIENVLHRVSNDGNMAVEDSGRPGHFFANGNAGVAKNVLAVVGEGPHGMKQFIPDVNFDDDCGAYAGAILKKMHDVNFVTHLAHKTTVNAIDETDVPFDTMKLFESELSGPATPSIGEIYLAVNNPNDLLITNKKHYNFHWATVIAQDGSDVITLEAAPKATAGWFQMYNHVNQSQTFGYHYIFTLGMLDEAAKVFWLRYHATKKEIKAPVYEEID